MMKAILNKIYPSRVLLLQAKFPQGKDLVAWVHINFLSLKKKKKTTNIFPYKEKAK